MTPAIRSWLPADTPPTPALQTLLAGAVDAWSARWFAAAPMTLAPLDRRPGNYVWRGLEAGLMLGMAPDAAAMLGARMLDVGMDDRGTRDRELLEEIAEDCVSDLRMRLAQLVEAPRGAEWRPVTPASAWSATIGSPHGPLALALSEALFAAMVQRALPKAPVGPLGSGAKALALLNVSVSAAMGRAELSIAELEALEIGDVVVLDHALAEPVPLAIDGHALARGRVRVLAGEPRPILEIVSAAA